MDRRCEKPHRPITKLASEPLVLKSKTVDTDALLSEIREIKAFGRQAWQQGCKSRSMRRFSL